MSKTKTNGIIMRVIAVLSLILFFIPFNKNDNVIEQFKAIKELISWMSELGSEFISASDVFLTIGIIGFIIFPIPIIILGCNNRAIGIIVSLVNCVFNVVYSIVFHIALNQYSNDISLSPKLIIISVLSIVIFIIAILNCVFKPKETGFSFEENTSYISDESYARSNVCPVCENILSPGAEFCGNCGTRQGSSNPISVPRNICPTCENALSPDAEFCGNCGTRLTKEDGTTDVPVTKINISDEKVSKETDSKTICPYCGESITTDTVFCGSCGHSLKSTPPVSSHTPKTPSMPIEPLDRPVTSGSSGTIKSTMRTKDKPIDPEEERKKSEGNSFFSKPTDL